MLTDAELQEIMNLIHGVVKWRAYDSEDSDNDYDDVCNHLHEAVDDLSETAIHKLIAIVNMKTMRSAT